MQDALRILVSIAVVVLIARTVRPAWRQRELAIRVWRRIRPRHVAGAFGLLALVTTVALGLFTYVPVLRVGLGTPLGLTGNAVFAPVEEVSTRTGGGGLASPNPVGGSTSSTLALAGIVAFLGLLAVLFPWLAYVEERTFREGLERASLAREAWTALRFGLMHLVMLIPVAAALAVAVAGFVYGRVYRRAYRSSERRVTSLLGPPESGVADPTRVALARDAAVLEATTWHTTFNTMIVLLVAIVLVVGW